MNNRIFLMRHGESTANRRELIASHPQNALTNYGLTLQGATQVSLAACESRLNQHTLIISSDFARARETADIVREVICARDSVIVDQRLRERNFGTWELQHVRHYQSVWSHDLHSPDRCVNGVEPITSVLQRGQALLADLERSYDSRRILLVSHGDVIQILLAHQQGLKARFHRSIHPVDNAEIRCLTPLLSSPHQAQDFASLALSR